MYSEMTGKQSGGKLISFLDHRDFFFFFSSSDVKKSTSGASGMIFFGDSRSMCAWGLDDTEKPCNDDIK